MLSRDICAFDQVTKHVKLGFLQVMAYTCRYRGIL